MRFARAVVVASAFVVFVTLGAGSASAAGTTIDNFNVQGTSSTFAECGSAMDSHSDSLPNGGTVMGSGPFNVSHTFAPAQASASCASGGGTDSTSGSMSSTGTTDASGGVTLNDSSQGSTTATASFTGGTDCVDVGADIATTTVVQFTITQAMPYTFSGTLSSSGNQAEGLGRVSYSLVRTTSPGGTIFDESKGLSPNLSGTLQPGTYQYRVQGDASNDFACSKSGSETDNYNYDVRLKLGGDHYQVEFKGWIAQPHVVDPYQPVTLPTMLVDQPPLLLLRPRCDFLTFPNNGLTSTSFRGDGHAGFPGSYRADMIINFDWDGSQISNFSTSGNNFGTTTLDFHVTAIDPLSPTLVISDDCTKTGMATQSAVGAVAFGGKGFLLQLDAADPLVSPQFAVPALDGKVLGLFNTQNGTPVLTLQFQTDIFPSFGVEVTKNGVVQATSLINDTSCIDPNSVLGPLGIPLLAFGLSSITQNTGQFTLQPSTTGASSARSSDLCSFSYDTLQLINNNLTFPARDVGASAAAGSKILVAPARGGRFVPLSQALKQGLLAGVGHPHLTSLLVDPRHPVRIKVIGQGVIAQESGLNHGRAGRAISFGPVAGTLILSAGKTVTATLNGHKLKPGKPDHKPPVTRATVTIKGNSAIVHLKATDASGVARTILIVGGKAVKLRNGTAKVKVSQLKTIRFYSVDALGNIERPRRLRR